VALGELKWGIGTDWKSNELNADNNLGADYADYTDSSPVI